MARPQHIWSDHAQRLCLRDFRIDRVSLIEILVSNVNISPPGPDQQCAEDHPLDNEIRGPQQDFAVLEGRRFAFIGVANDVGAIGTLALVTHFAPLAERRPAGSPHAARSDVFSSSMSPGQPLFARPGQRPA